MDHIDNVYNSLKHYFSVLEQTGNYRKQSTLSLLVYAFIVTQLLEGPLQYYLEDNDVVTLNRLMACLGRDNCLIEPIISRQRIGKPNSYYMPSMFRYSEDAVIRNTEDNNQRITEIKS